MISASTPARSAGSVASDRVSHAIGAHCNRAMRSRRMMRYYRGRCETDPRFRLAAPGGAADERRLRVRSRGRGRRREPRRAEEPRRRTSSRVARDKAQPSRPAMHRDGRRRARRRHDRRRRQRDPRQAAERRGRRTHAAALSGTVHEVLTGVVVRRGHARAGRARHDARPLPPAHATTKSPGTSARASPMARPAPTRFRGGRRGSSTGSTARGRTSSGCRSRRCTACSKTPGASIDRVGTRGVF